MPLLIIKYNMFKIFDLHNDYILKLRGINRERYLKKVTSANSVVSAVWTSELGSDDSMSELKASSEYVSGKNNTYFAVEDLHFLNSKNVDEFIKFKPLYAGLTWNTTNCIAGGANEQGNLSNFGKSVVKKLEAACTFIDTAHLNEDSFMSLSKVATRPFFCSHTACYGVFGCPRNLKDYQIKMIIESGGIVGLYLVSDFLNGTKRCTIKDFVTHIDYFACKFGINNLAVGTDFYGTNHLPKGATNYDKLIGGVSRALTQLGYTEKCIRKIFFENAENFFFGQKI